MRRVLLVLYTGILAYAQLAPTRVVGERDPVIELLIHMGMYFGFCILVAWNMKPNPWMVILIGLIGGAGLEALQSFVPGRQPDVHDLVGNVVGVLLAAGVVSAWVELHEPIGGQA